MHRLTPLLILTLLIAASYVVIDKALFILSAKTTYGLILNTAEAGDCAASMDSAKCDWNHYLPVSLRDDNGDQHIVPVAGVTRDSSRYSGVKELELLHIPGELMSVTENRFLSKWGFALTFCLVVIIATIGYLTVYPDTSNTWSYRTNTSLLLALGIMWFTVGAYETATSATLQNIVRPNKIMDVKFVSMSPSLLELHVTYYYNGRYGSQTEITSRPGNNDNQYLWNTKPQPLQEGEHIVHFQHRLDPFKDQAICTEFTTLAMHKPGGSNFFEVQADHHHCWEYAMDKNIGTDCEIKTN